MLFTREVKPTYTNYFAFDTNATAYIWKVAILTG